MPNIDSPKIICSSSGQNIWIHSVMWYVSTTIISYSSDYGVSWSQNSTPLTNTNLIAASDDGKYMYISKYSVGLYYSSDYGVTWTLNNNIPGGLFNEIQCSPNGKIVYVAFNYTTIYKSINYGKTFTAFIQPIEYLKLLRSGILVTAYGNNLYAEAVVNTIFNGYIDEFNIYDKKLTADEVNILYNNNNNIANFNYSNHLQSGTYYGNIIPRKLTPIWSINTRNYNATTKFNYSFTLNNKITDDILDISNIIIYDYTNPDIGLSKPANFSNIALIGDNYFNYDICSNSIAYGTVNPAELVPKLNIDKTYDKSTRVIVNNSQLLVRNLNGLSVENILVGVGSDLYFNANNNNIYWYKSSNITSIFTNVKKLINRELRRFQISPLLQLNKERYKRLYDIKGLFVSLYNYTRQYNELKEEKISQLIEEIGKLNSRLTEKVQLQRTTKDKQQLEIEINEINIELAKLNSLLTEYMSLDIYTLRQKYLKYKQKYLQLKQKYLQLKNRNKI